MNRDKTFNSVIKHPWNDKFKDLNFLIIFCLKSLILDQVYNQYSKFIRLIFNRLYKFSVVTLSLNIRNRICH